MRIRLYSLVAATAFAVGSVGVFAAASPAGATKSSPTATAGGGGGPGTSGCDFEVIYTWDGFSGPSKASAIELQLFDKSGLYSSLLIPGPIHNSGQVIHSFHVINPNSDTYYPGGELLDRTGAVVSGSVAVASVRDMDACPPTP
jgi:hypothetical protein